MKKLQIAYVLTFLCWGGSVVAQQAKPKPKLVEITLSNPSFEDTPRKGEKGGSAPSGWFDCGGPNETSPDIQPGCLA